MPGHHPLLPTLLVLLLIVVLQFTTGLVLEGSDSSYVKFKPWTGESDLILEFSTIQPNGLLLYTDDGVGNDYFELKLVEGSLRLRFNLDKDGQSLILGLGSHLNDGLWHRTHLRRSGPETSLTLDGFITQTKLSTGRDTLFGSGSNSHVYIGGLPTSYNNRIGDLSLPSVVFEPRFRGAVRNLMYAAQAGGSEKPQEVLEAKGLVIGGGEACDRHDPCQHGGFCISTDNGPVCDCKHVEFQGSFCEREKESAEATFTGQEYIEYDMRSNSPGGGEAILSTLDEISFVFKTTNGNGLLFYSGDGIDYFSISLREGRLYLSINIGSGPLDTKIHPDRFNDNHWHSVRIHRKIQEMSKMTSLCHITSNLDGLHFERWTLAGAFTILSSNHVTIGGYNTLQPLIIGIYDQPSCFIGCLRKVEFRADTLRLDLLDLARTRHRLISIHGDIGFKCYHSSSNAQEPRVPNLQQQPSGTAAVTFTTADSFLVLTPPNSSTVESISFQLRTTEANGLILYAAARDGVAFPPPKHVPHISISLLHSQLHLSIGLGSDPLRVQGTQTPLNDGEWHTVTIARSGRSGHLTVDNLVTQFNCPAGGVGEVLFGKVYIGGVEVTLLTAKYASSSWGAGLNTGYLGCLRGFVLDKEEIDLQAAVVSGDVGSIRPLCHPSNINPCDSAPCRNGACTPHSSGGFTCDCTHTDYTGHTCQRAAVSATFDGSQQSIQFPANLQLEAQDISVRFRTSRPTGLLLRMGSGPDFCQLSLEFTRVKFTIRIQGREKSLAAGSELSDNQWHRIRVTRRGTALRIGIDGGSEVTGDLLSRHPTLPITQISIGSAPTTSILPFSGHLTHILLNSIDLLHLLPLLNATSTAKIHIPPSEQTSIVSITNTYIGLQQLKAYSTVEIQLQFRTNGKAGLVLYNSGNYGDFIGLYLEGGRLHYEYDLGAGRVKFESGFVSDGRWHGVRVLRIGGYDWFEVDGQQERRGDTSGYLDLNGVLYVGGVPPMMYATLPFGVRTGYSGCLASVELNGEAVDLVRDALLPSQVVGRGCEETSTICACADANGCSTLDGGDCDCATGTECKAASPATTTTYDFGPSAPGLLLYSYPPTIPTHDIQLKFKFTTRSPDGVLVRWEEPIGAEVVTVQVTSGRLTATSPKMAPLKSKSIVSDGSVVTVSYRRESDRISLSVGGWNGSRAVVGGAPSPPLFFTHSGQVQIGGRWRSDTRRIESPFQGSISSLVLNRRRPLQMVAAAAGGKRPKTSAVERVRVIGDVRQRAELMEADLQQMQKTPASAHSTIDDLISSSGCLLDDEDECIPVFDTGSGSPGDDLITPVYITTTTRSRPPSTTTTTTNWASKTFIPCDDEDCFPGGGSGEAPVVTVSIGETTIEAGTTIIQTFHDTTTDFVTTTTEDTTTTTSTTTTTTSTPSTTVRFVPPTTPKPVIYPVGSIFDENFGIQVRSTNQPHPKQPRDSFVAETSDSTLIIIIIIALLMIIIVSILIIFFMCKRREDPVYKVEQRYEGFAAQPQQVQAASRVRKQGVKEWYV